MKRFALYSIFVLSGLAGSAFGDILTGGSGEAGDASVTLPGSGVSFVMSSTVSAGNPLFFVVESPAGSDSTYTELPLSGMVFSVGADPTEYGVVSWIDAWEFAQGDIGASDSVFVVGSLPVSANESDSVTLKTTPTAAVTASSSSFTVFQSGGYNMYIADVGGNRVSDVVAVPEPSAMALIGLAAIGGLMGRRWLTR